MGIRDGRCLLRDPLNINGGGHGTTINQAIIKICRTPVLISPATKARRSFCSSSFFFSPPSLAFFRYPCSITSIPRARQFPIPLPDRKTLFLHSSCSNTFTYDTLLRLGRWLIGERWFFYAFVIVIKLVSSLLIRKETTDLYLINIFAIWRMVVSRDKKKWNCNRVIYITLNFNKVALRSVIRNFGGDRRWNLPRSIASGAENLSSRLRKTKYVISLPVSS